MRIGRTRLKSQPRSPDPGRRLLVGQPLVPLALEGGALPFRVEPPLPRGPRGPRGAARHRRDGGAPDHVNQTLARILTIALLRPVALSDDDENALPRHAAASQLSRPLPYILWQ